MAKHAVQSARSARRHGWLMPESQRLNRLILAGFALLLTLMVGWGVHTLWHIQQLADQMDQLVQVRNLKIQLATDLQEASYNRHNSLVYQTLLSDPFERDEMYQQFTRWGYLVGKARNALKRLDLDEHELGNVRQQDSLIDKIVVLHEEISDLAASGNLEQARALLTEQLRPLNLGFIDTVEALRRYERDHISRELRLARTSARKAVMVSIGLGGILLALAGAIAYFTHRQFRTYAGTLNEQVQLLEAVGRSLEHQATHDCLTGVANRTLFNQRLEEELARARDENRAIMLIYLDLDDFKPVNDRHGHAMGDALLQAVAQRLRNTVGENDIVARLGGDEFAVLFTHPGDAEQQAALCARLEQAVCQPVYMVGGLSLTPGCSIGRAVYPRDGGSVQELIHAADTDMYQVKLARKTENRAA
ncbi:MAG TPA: diguanylate cyclase [Thiobacillaceae bacterium]|nr:diguanylate cyclase [Thiobacillaceae bacterium]